MTKSLWVVLLDPSLLCSFVWCSVSELISGGPASALKVSKPSTKDAKTVTAMFWMLVHNMCVVNGERVHVAVVSLCTLFAVCCI